MAKRFAELRGLIPPVDALAIAKSLAITQLIDFPIWAQCDGLTLDLKIPGKRPKIFINSRSGHHRQRFTAAHEIGHLIIPWHIGDIVDDLTEGDDEPNSPYRRIEAQANRFAAELLMPRDWVAGICNNVNHLRGAVLTIAEVADVSLAAAALRVKQFGPPGYVIAHCREGMITFIGQTSGTKASLPREGTSIYDFQLSAFYEPEIFASTSAAVYVWKERESLAPPDLPAGDWRRTLAEMLDSIPEERRKSAHSQINAIVGYQLGKHPRGTPVELIYKDVVKAFENRTDRQKDIRDLRQHPLFDLYLLGRIHQRANQSTYKQDL